MVQNFEFKGGYGVYKLRPHVGRSKMTNWLHASPVVKESMYIHTQEKNVEDKCKKNLM